MNDMKRQYITALLLAQSVINGESHPSNGYFTYFTNIGVVMGKRINFIFKEYKTEEEFTEDISNKSKEGEGISIYELANAYLTWMMKEADKDYDNNNTDSKAIVLEDVTIKDLNGNIIKTNSFVLFTDQITGLVPGKTQDIF